MVDIDYYSAYEKADGVEWRVERGRINIFDISIISDVTQSVPVQGTVQVANPPKRHLHTVFMKGNAGYRIDKEQLMKLNEVIDDVQAKLMSKYN